MINKMKYLKLLILLPILIVFILVLTIACVRQSTVASSKINSTNNSTQSTYSKSTTLSTTLNKNSTTMQKTAAQAQTQSGNQTRMAAATNTPPPTVKKTDNISSKTIEKTPVQAAHTPADIAQNNAVQPAVSEEKPIQNEAPSNEPASSEDNNQGSYNQEPVVQEPVNQTPAPTPAPTPTPAAQEPAKNGTPIIAPPSATVEQAQKWAKSRGATQTFIDLAPLFWELSQFSGVDPAVAYAQAAKETGFGRFTGVLDESFHNTCGLKTTQGGDNYDPNAHMRFPDWRTGILAHLDHLALYAGAPGYPKADSPDPRHFKYLYGRAATVEELGGNWAPSSDYGISIVRDYLTGLRNTR